MFDLVSFLAANSFIQSNRSFYPWIATSAALKTAILFIGPNGFDAVGIARFAWASTRESQRAFVRESALAFRKKTQFVAVMERARAGDLLLTDFELLSPKLTDALFQLAKEFDVRILASTCQRHDFMQIFRHRLHIPPLSERREDLFFLIKLFAPKESRFFSQEVLKVMQKHHWPDDCEELRAVLSRLSGTIALGKPLTSTLVQSELLTHAHTYDVSLIGEVLKPEKIFEATRLLGLRKTSRLIEAIAIRQALQHARGEKSLAARHLGMSPSTLSSRISALSAYLGGEI